MRIFLRNEPQYMRTSDTAIRVNEDTSRVCVQWTDLIIAMCLFFICLFNSMCGLLAATTSASTSTSADPLPTEAVSDFSSCGAIVRVGGCDGRGRLNRGVLSLKGVHTACGPVVHSAYIRCDMENANRTQVDCETTGVPLFTVMRQRIGPKISS